MCLRDRPGLTTIYWRDIPAQVTATTEDGGADVDQGRKVQERTLRVMRFSLFLGLLVVAGVFLGFFFGGLLKDKATLIIACIMFPLAFLLVLMLNLKYALGVSCLACSATLFRMQHRLFRPFHIGWHAMPFSLYMEVRPHDEVGAQIIMLVALAAASTLFIFPPGAFASRPAALVKEETRGGSSRSRRDVAGS